MSPFLACRGTSLRDAIITPPEAGSFLHGRKPGGLGENGFADYMQFLAA